MAEERRRLDFDAARRERHGQPLEVVLGGQVYLLPAQLPAPVALDIVDMKRLEEAAEATSCAAHQTQVADCESCKYAAQKAKEAMGIAGWEKLLDLGGELFGGREKMKAIARDHELSIEELGDLIMGVFDSYNAEIPGPNRQRPANRAQKRAVRQRRASG
jgi:hypothetical protein